MLQFKTETIEIRNMDVAAAIVEWKYGTPKIVPLWAVGNALLDDLAHTKAIPAFAEALDVEDVPSLQPRLVPVYDEDGLRAGDLFAVVVPENRRVGLSDNGNAVWVDADTVEEALLIYESGCE